MGEAKLSWFVVLVYGVMAGFGIAFLFGLWMLVSDLRFSRQAIPVEAVISDIEYISVPGRVNSQNSFPTFIFTDQGGESHQVKVAKGWPSSLRLNDRVDILYNPAAPAAKLEASSWRWWKGFGALITAVTAPFMVMVFLRSRKSGSTENQKRQRRNQLARERRARLKAERKGKPKNGPDE